MQIQAKLMPKNQAPGLCSMSLRTSSIAPVQCDGNEIASPMFTHGLIGLLECMIAVLTGTGFEF